MATRNRLVSFCAVIVSLTFSSASFAATRLDSLTVGYSSFSGAYGPLWVAVEDHLGKKHNLDIKAIYAGRIRPQQLLASGEVPYVVATGTGALPSHIRGIKDQVIVLTFINKVGSASLPRTDIKRPDERRRGSLAPGRPGAFADTMV